MHKAKVSIEHNDVLGVYFIYFKFGKRTLQLIANCKENRCFITNFELKHHLNHSSILTNVKNKSIEEKRLVEMYLDINAELANYDACIGMTEQQWIEFITDNVF